MIEVRDLTKHYGQVKALHRLSLEIKKGEVFGLLGPNGAGKTTLIRCLTTLAKPDSGVCRIEGFDVQRDGAELKKIIGVMPQENNLDKELTAHENLLIYGMLHRVEDLRNRIDQFLKLVGLVDRRDSLVSHFSGGMQRRLLLARALMTNPKVLFLDEPSIGLDPQIRRQMWDLIRKARIDGRTVVLTTHYIEEAEALCQRVAILSKGELIALDSPENLKAKIGPYVVEYVDGNGHLVQHLCQSRSDAHALAGRLENNVTIRKANLEDLFVKLTGERLE
ncbi:MAG: ABC transporter ATP-binding protein [Desulfobacterota bacterium]|nr:ABC transporter ATP-binding protein [Thermodesulfobacteriota bacterium]